FPPGWGSSSVCGPRSARHGWRRSTRCETNRHPAFRSGGNTGAAEGDTETAEGLGITNDELRITNYELRQPTLRLLRSRSRHGLGLNTTIASPSPNASPPPAAIATYWVPSSS